jgi:putative N6-adenine-specific DNA methylase
MELDLFAACLPGLEPLLAAELQGLGMAPTETAGGVEFRGGRDALLAAHLHLGTASHLLLRCARFRCRNLQELQTRTAQLPWPRWLRRDVPFAVRATARKSRLYHTGAIEERVRRGVAMALAGGGEPAAGAAVPLAAGAGVPLAAGAGIPLAVRVVDDVVAISLDTSDEPLHRRGYRLESAKAPLREDLAHALLRAAAFARGQALLDPFCGAGTIAIEAAAIALALPPGRLRPPPLRGTALADDDRWHALVAAAVRAAAGTAGAAMPIAASDRDAGAVAAARRNAERAGVLHALDLRHCAVSRAPWLEHPDTAPRPLLLATNPPFGLRVAAGRDLGNLYQTLGHLALRLGESARTAILAHDHRLARRTGLTLRAAFTTRHGGLHVSALVGALAAAAPSSAPPA